jgi:hypothetical protein
MLDFVFLQQQLNSMVIDQKTTRRGYTNQITLAQQTLLEWSDRWELLGERTEESRTSWLVAKDMQESLRNRHPAPLCPAQMSVIATDGSQIFPDHHEFVACYVLNIGTVLIHYGTGERAQLNSQPLLFYREQDLYQEWNGEQIPINEEIISARRGAFEIKELVRLAIQAAEQKHRVIGMVDGSLILWKLEKKPFKKEILHVYLDSFEQFRRWQIPVLGYISRPQGADVVNALRVGLCGDAGGEDPISCDRCPFRGKNHHLPCESIKGISDALLFATILQPGERSPAFRSSSTILDEYGSHAIYFFYLNVGAEIVRIETPRWVVQEPEMLDFIHAAAYSQAQKGQGYPVSLAEAHEQAVIRGSEREQFYRRLEELYVWQGIEVKFSRKLIKKRNAGV